MILDLQQCTFLVPVRDCSEFVHIRLFGVDLYIDVTSDVGGRVGLANSGLHNNM